MKRAAPLVAFAIALLAPGAARAFERQQHVGVDAGGAYMTTSGTGKVGIDFGLHYTYGLTDAFNVTAEAGWAGFTSSGATGPQPSSVAFGGVGLLYVFDVLRWVPYAGGILGPAVLGGGATANTFVVPDAQLAVGLDYAISRTWSVGGAYREHFFLTKMDTYPVFTSLQLRVEYVWGW